MCSYQDEMGKYGWVKHDGKTYGKQLLEDPNNGVDYTVEWLKPGDEESDPNKWVLRVEGTARDDYTGQNDISMMWYVATNGGNKVNYDMTTQSLTGYHTSIDDTFWLSYIDGPNNTSPTYDSGQGWSDTYDQTYIQVLTIQEGDNWDPVTPFHNELKNYGGSTPQHLLDPN